MLRLEGRRDRARPTTITERKEIARPYLRERKERNYLEFSQLAGLVNECPVFRN